jgi:hypothetical protein
MKHEIVYTDDYALIVSDEQIEDVRPFIGRYHLEKGNMIYQFPTYLTDLTYCKLIIAHRPLTDSPILEGVPLLLEFSQDNVVEDLAKDVFPYLGSERVKSEQNRHTDILRYGFKAGYNKSKETYNLSVAKLLDLYIEETGYGMDMWSKEENQTMSTITKIIQSLQQPKRPKYFECEMEPKYKHIGAVKGIYGSGFRKQNLMYGLPKTITNSQGQKELVGSYTY